MFKCVANIRKTADRAAHRALRHQLDPDCRTATVAAHVINRKANYRACAWLLTVILPFGLVTSSFSICMRVFFLLNDNRPTSAQLEILLDVQ